MKNIMGEWAFFANQTFNGLSVASILALVAVGLAMSFGLQRVINMAHGEWLMLGGYMAYLAYQALPLPLCLLAALPLGFVVGALAALLLEVAVIRHLYGRPLETLLATWGVSLILQQAARNAFGPVGVEVAAPPWLAGTIHLAEISLPWVRLFVIALAAAALLGLAAFLRHTTLGLQLRAVSQNREMAASLGIYTRGVDAVAFALGGGLAGLAGAALALIAPVTPTVGQSYIVDAFLVVILGGVGSLGGAALAALLLGLTSATLQGLTSVSLAKVILLFLVVLFLQLRPRGLLPSRTRALEEV
ncbi:urea ABC transporter permease subunit UrtB [Thermus scotoductus]|nr:urea ABC transporter permease subunit UrtB [Thermus scotoductus]